ncbi:hypothetical protein AB595_14435 [Massilia sp. WF1]|uniref:general secretion pathway protein GspB n=1 Tax=unclassified Massilia TaxID=2609279 RepID=UPI00064B725B|nr:MULTISPECIES: general secretion pathway protein GspB [unclassified Massilia]ALK96205.1 hypothetical protein AM586_07860 [Massilia sp. WG5]KLU36178.1 hypothetical protein AB595_14435 [Massilia sp. WF1]
MSYILEALKKAQAERQLGNAPTIHAPQPAQAAAPGVAASRKPLLIGLGAGALVVAAGALFVWQRGPSPAAPASAQPANAALVPAAPAAGPAGVPASPARATSPGATSPGAAGAASTTLEVSAPPAPPPPAPHPAQVAGAPAHPAAAATGRAGADALASAAPPRAPATAPAMPAAPAAARAPVAAPAPEDSLPFLQQLPDAVQREVPRVSFGGYMYSANPADRLLLIDKALRHEGEEVAPGLFLEKLLPKAAVMNYRGVRYRVAY